MDEPSNHLDLETMEWLEAYLKEYKVIVIIVSHDRYFINNIANRVVELAEGFFISYEGNYDYYKEKISQLKSMAVTSKIAKEDNKATKIKKEKTPKVTKSSNEFKKLKLEKEIEELEERLKSIEDQINQFANNYEKLSALYAEKLELQQELERLIEEYFN